MKYPVPEGYIVEQHPHSHQLWRWRTPSGFESTTGEPAMAAIKCWQHLAMASKLPLADDVEQRDDDKWYFWDEVQADEYGPYDSREEAMNARSEYVQAVLG